MSVHSSQGSVTWFLANIPQTTCSQISTKCAVYRRSSFKYHEWLLCRNATLFSKPINSPQFSLSFSSKHYKYLMLCLLVSSSGFSVLEWWCDCRCSGPSLWQHLWGIFARLGMFQWHEQLPDWCNLISRVLKGHNKAKVIPLHATKALGGRRGIAPIHSQPRH
jgi:hypothetical protein